MVVRTNQLAHVAAVAPAGGGVTLFTCPAGRTTIIKNVALHNRAVDTRTLTVTVRTGTLTTSVAAVSLVAGQPTTLGPWFLVLEPGQDLRLVTSPAGGDIGAVVSGTLLDGAPI